MSKYQLTISDNEPRIYTDLYEIAKEFHNSDPSKTPQKWHQQLLLAFSAGNILVNTGIDGNRLRAKKVKTVEA